MKKILSIVGTRPEVIKMAPVIKELEKQRGVQSIVVTTAQHRQMLDQMLDLFAIQPAIDLNLMQHDQTLAELTAKLSLPLDQLFKTEKPDIVLAQGDTTTAFLVSLSCFYRKIPFAHIEAGLRTKNRWDPFPEEMNRTLISQLSSINFAPTEQARQNLLASGTNEGTIFVTGNTVIDALFTILEKNIPLDKRIDLTKKIVLVTTHRRENWGDKLASICRAVKTLAKNNKDIQIVIPVHLNPNVKELITQELGNLERVLLLDPLPYQNFVTLMKKSTLILSDSGGVQEEAPSLKVPVLVLRETTERPEGVWAGACRLVGTDDKTIVSVSEMLLKNPIEREKMVIEKSPYGDGKSSKRIVNILKKM